MFASEHPASSGTSSAEPVYTATGSASVTNGPCGATVIMRLREVEPPLSTVDPIGMCGFFGI
jgi:hypothetical protein